MGHVEMTIEAGGQKVETTLDELREAADLVHSAQLSLDVGGDPGLPISPTFQISGKLSSIDQLFRGDRVKVTITDEHGEVVARSGAWVNQVAFKEHRPEKDPWFVERAHTIKIGDD